MSNSFTDFIRHSNEKPFLCTHCGKAYKSRTAMRWHIRSHKHGKMFKCHKCEYEAIQNSHLRRHMETHDIQKRYMCGHCDYSSNTVGYMKVHYTKFHKGVVYNQRTMVENPNTSAQVSSQPDARVYKCVSCDYLFGNLSDMRRHLRVRHNIQVYDITEFQEQTNVPSVVATEEVSGSQLQVIQMDNTQPLTFNTQEENDATLALQALQSQGSTEATEIDDQTAVSLLQQIIDMQQSHQLPQPQEVTEMETQSSMVALNPETIIVQETNDSEVVVTASQADPANENEYIIQYMTPQGEPISVSDVTNISVSEEIMETDNLEIAETPGEEVVELHEGLKEEEIQAS